MTVVEMSTSRITSWRGIRSSALVLFDTRGYANVSVEEIADAAGVSRRTFFNYFPTKASVLFDPDPSLGSGLRAQLDSQAKAKPWDALCAVLVGYVEAEAPVVIARRRILDADPALAPFHLLANTHFEDSIRGWLREDGVDAFRAGVTTAVALAIVREAFTAWDFSSGITGLVRSMRQGFALVASGMASSPHDVT